MEASAVPWWAPAGVTGVASPKLLRLASDDRLVALIRTGNMAAFEAAYDRHHRPILSFCRHVLGSADEAEDAVQHTFFAAYRDLIASDKPVHLRPWLFTIARNRCYTIIRARREQPVEELSEQVGEGLSSEVQRRQDLRDLVLDLRRLPVEQRSALVLAELDSLSHEEIGAVLGVPREKVKALVFQARESLIASRDARETDCHEIRTQLMTMRGGALRRGNLRRHLRECEGCRQFRSEYEHQRRRLALILPVAPTIALKEGVIGAAAGGSAAGSVAGGGLVAGMALKGSAIKGIVASALAAVGTAGTLVAVGTLAPAVSHPNGSHSAQYGSPRGARSPVRGARVAPLAGAASRGVGASTRPAFSLTAGQSGLGPLGANGGLTGPLAGIGLVPGLTTGGSTAPPTPNLGNPGGVGGAVTIGTPPNWPVFNAAPPLLSTPVDGSRGGGMPAASGRTAPGAGGSPPPAAGSSPASGVAAPTTPTDTSSPTVGFSGRATPATPTATAPAAGGQTPSSQTGSGALGPAGTGGQGAGAPGDSTATGGAAGTGTATGSGSPRETTTPFGVTTRGTTAGTAAASTSSPAPTSGAAGAAGAIPSGTPPHP